MNVMSASVFNAGILRFVRNVIHFRDWQRVHVCADGDDRAGLATLQYRYHAVSADASANVSKADHLQSLGDYARCALFAVRQFGMHVEVATLVDETAAHGVGGRS